MQHQRHSYIDSIDVLDLSRGRLGLHRSLESKDNLCRNVAHAAPSRPFVEFHIFPKSLRFGFVHNLFFSMHSIKRDIDVGDSIH